MPAFQYAQAADDATDVGSDTTSIDAIAIKWVTQTGLDSDGAYVQKPDGNNEQVNYKAQFEYALSGNSDHEPGTVEIRIPASIFTARDGTSKADAVTLSVPAAPTVPNNGDFNYSYDAATDEYVLTNCKTISAASKTSFDVTYSIKRPSNVVDMKPSKSLSAKIKVMAADGTEHEAQSNAISAKLDTQARLTKVYKSAYQMVSTYPSGWGDAPADADDYFYVIWNYQVVVPRGNTQPWKMTSQDVLGNDGGTIVGYRTVSSRYPYTYTATDLTKTQAPKGDFSTEAPTWLMSSPETRETSYFGSVLAKYPKSIIDENQEHTFTNAATATLIGDDDGVPSVASADASYTYKPLEFSLPGGTQQVQKDQTPRSDGGLTMLENGNPATFSSDSDETFYNRCSVKRYDLTLKDGGDSSNPDDYGQKPYTVELIDDAMFLDGDYGQELGAQDANIASCKVWADVYDYVPNQMKGSYEEQTHTDRATKPNIELWGQFGTSEWTKVTTLKASSNGSWYSADGSRNVTVSMPDGCTAVKAVCTSAFYRVDLHLYVQPKLLPSDRVKNLVAGKDSCTLRDFNTLRVLDADGKDEATTAYLSGEYGKTRIGERDKALFGTGLYHASATGYLTRMETHSSMDKQLESYSNDTVNRRVVLKYAARAYEELYYPSDAGLTGDKLVEMGLFKPQRTGTFYDLLPMGVEPDASSVHVTNVRSSFDTGDVSLNVDSVETIENYRDSGRTMLVVKASLPEGAGNALFDRSSYWRPNVRSGMLLRFTAYYSWDEYNDYGQKLLNSIAYETGNDALGDGFADTGQGMKEGDLFEDLDGDGNPPGTPKRFVYAYCSDNINVNVSASMDLTKTVKGPENSSWTNGQDGSVVVGKGESYIYRLRVGAATNSSMTNMVFYDSLENYHPENGGPQWRGTLESVDVSQLENKGVAPVIYYSTVPDLSIADHMDLTDASVWSAVAPADLSKVTAIAIDCSKDKAGKEFKISEHSSVVAFVHMKAPDGGTYGPSAEAEAHAYNNVYFKSVLHNSLNGTISDQIIHNEFTQVSLKKAVVQPLPSLGWLGSWPVAVAGALLVVLAAAALAYARHTKGRHSIARRGEAPQAK